MKTKVGVIGVGNMGSQHARIYNSLQESTLVGVVDEDRQTAIEVANTYETSVLSQEELIDRVDAVSIVVPTQHHYEIARDCIESDVDILVEKPFVAVPDQGAKLIELAEKREVLIQVGHVERFNPAVMALKDVLAETDVLAYEVRRLGPDTGRKIQDSVVIDLMIHDIDIVRTLVGSDPESVNATGSHGGRHATATLKFGDETMATLTASRITQRKVRQLGIATEDSYVSVDYLDRQIEIYRGSMKQLVDRDGERRYRHESVIELPFIENTEPLKNEITDFLQTIKEGRTPTVSAQEGLNAVKLAKEIEHRAFR